MLILSHRLDRLVANGSLVESGLALLRARSGMRTRRMPWLSSTAFPRTCACFASVCSENCATRDPGRWPSPARPRLVEDDQDRCPLLVLGCFLRLEGIGSRVKRFARPVWN